MKRLLRWLLRLVGLFVLLLATLAIYFAVLNRNLPRQSAVVDRLSAAESARLAELFHLRQTLGDAVWPGWGEADIPVIVYNEAYVFLVGYPDPPAGWQKVTRDGAAGGSWAPVPDDTFLGAVYYRQRLPAGAGPEAFTVQVGDRWVASMPTMEWMAISLAEQFRTMLPSFLEPIFPYALVNGLFLRGSDGYISLLAHETFHAYQGTMARNALVASESAAARLAADYPVVDLAFEADWQTELDLLAEALRAEDAAATAELAHRFLTQRAARRDAVGLSEALVDYERRREWSEGLAKYVELAVWRAAVRSPGYESVTAIQADPDFDAYTGFDVHWSREVDQIGRMAGDGGDGRFYYSGLAQAVMLDRLRPGWKERAMVEGAFLENLLATAVGWPEATATIVLVPTTS